MLADDDDEVEEKAPAPKPKAAVAKPAAVAPIKKPAAAAAAAKPKPTAASVVPAKKPVVPVAKPVAAPAKKPVAPAPKAPVRSAAAALSAMQTDEPAEEEDDGVTVEEAITPRKAAKKRPLPQPVAAADEADDDEEETKGKRSRKKTPAEDQELNESYIFREWFAYKYVSRHAGLVVKDPRITAMAAITSRKALSRFSKWFSDTIGAESELSFKVLEDYSNLPSCFSELFTEASEKERKLLPNSKGAQITAHMFQVTSSQPVELPIHHATQRVQESLFFPLMQSSPAARVVLRYSPPLDNTGTLERDDADGRPFGVAAATQFFRLPSVKDTPMLFQLSVLDRQNRFHDPEQKHGVPRTSVMMVDDAAHDDVCTPLSEDDFREKVGVFKFMVFTWQQTRVRAKKATGDEPVAPPPSKKARVEKSKKARQEEEEEAAEDSEGTVDNHAEEEEEAVVEETVEQVEEEEEPAPPKSKPAVAAAKPAASKSAIAAAAPKSKPVAKPVPRVEDDDVDITDMQVDVGAQNQAILRAQIAKMQADNKAAKAKKESEAAAAAAAAAAEEAAPPSPTSRDFESGAEVPLDDEEPTAADPTEHVKQAEQPDAKQAELNVCLLSFPDEQRKNRIKEYFKTNVVPFATLNARLMEPEGTDEQKRTALLADAKAFVRTIGGIDGPSGRLITWTNTHKAFVITPRDGTRTFFVEVSLALAARLLTPNELQAFKMILGKPRVSLNGERITVVKVTSEDPLNLDELAKFVSDTKNLELDVPATTPKSAVVE